MVDQGTISRKLQLQRTKTGADTPTGSITREKPLVVNAINPRYFQDFNGSLVYLTGSHTWGNLQDYDFNFLVDTNSTTFLKALWKFDSAALETDPSGTGKTLTNSGVVGETSNHIEGTGCGNWELGDPDYMYRTNANWVGPWKSDDAVKTGSVCAWIKMESLAGTMIVFSKFDSGSTYKFSIVCFIWDSGKAGFGLGYNSGEDAEWKTHDSILSTGTWYHITWSYNNSDKSYAIRVRDEDGDIVGTDKTGTATLDANKLTVTDSPVRIGAYTEDGSLALYFDGLIDRMAVFNRVITSYESTLMAQSLPFDWDEYITFLTGYGHNYIRLWAVDTGEGTPHKYSIDVNGKWDVTSINQSLLDRLASRVASALAAGMYVGINLFMPDSVKATSDWAIHYFNEDNNSNSIDGDTNDDNYGYETYDITPEITDITDEQKAWIEAVVDEVNAYDNVLWEIGNEGDWSSAGWQYAMIDYLIAYELTKPKQHPVIMSSVMDWQDTHDPDDSLLLAEACNADAVGFGTATYGGSPTVAAGTKVSILDVDHFFNLSAPKGQWPWRAFMRGHNPILMDWYTYGDPTAWTVAEQEEMRDNMGFTKTYADKIGLVNMIPQASGTGTPSETNYCLYNTGQEYLFFQPDAGGANFEIVVTTKSYDYEWFNITTGAVHSSGTSEWSSGDIDVPFNAPAVLWLKEA
ncbi:MAG: LamG domain-containing protein [Deltaproteobacteria bacterium]|nr:MAG: LamG domain-containing protein [Deltaproteobacteria bacterium]